MRAACSMRGQLLIGVEDVELGFVGDEGRAGVFAVVVAGIGQARQFAHFADGQILDDSA